MCPSDDVRGCPHILPADWRVGVPIAQLTVVVSHLYTCEGLSTYRIGRLLGMHRQRVGRLLVQASVAVKPRGAGRPRALNDQDAAAADAMARLYVRAGLTTVQISALTGVPDRTVRDRLRARGVRPSPAVGLPRSSSSTRCTQTRWYGARWPGTTSDAAPLVAPSGSGSGCPFR
jgi:hypothetical protein